MPRVYLAAPLFSPSERQYNQSLAQFLGQEHDVFLPQRDGVLVAALIESGADAPTTYARAFRADIEAIKQSDFLVAVLDGRTVDEGVAFEMGFAFGIGIPVVGIHTDSRVLLASGLNPMIVGGACSIVRDQNELVEALEILGVRLVDKAKPINHHR